MPELLASLSSWLTLVFAVSIMLSMGLRLSTSQIVDSLSNLRLAILALVANFVIVPAAGFALVSLLVTDQNLGIGLLLISMVAGAPLVPKLALMAMGNLPFAVGLVVMQTVATVVYLPLALPLLLPGVQVDTLSVARPLFLQMLVPLGVGLYVNFRYAEVAGKVRPIFERIASFTLVIVMALLLGMNTDGMLGLIGSGALITTLLLTAIALLAGYFLGGPDQGNQKSLSLSTGQRNMAAAFVVGAGNFADEPDVLMMLAVAGAISVIITILVAIGFGRRSKVPTSVAPEIRS